MNGAVGIPTTPGGLTRTYHDVANKLFDLAKQARSAETMVQRAGRIGAAGRADRQAFFAKNRKLMGSNVKPVKSFAAIRGWSRGPGRYKGPLSRPKKISRKAKRAGKKIVSGAQIQIENNFESNTATTTQYITFATPTQYVMKVMVMAIIKRIWSKLNLTIEAWTDIIPILDLGDGSIAQVATLVVYYYRADNSTLLSINTNFTTGTTTFNQLVDSLVANLGDIYSGSTVLVNEIQINNISLQWVSGGTRFPRKQFYCQNWKINGYMSHAYHVQNITLNSDAVAGTSTTTVNTNPLSVKLYKGKGTGPLPDVARRGNFPGLIAKADIGSSTYAPTSSFANGNEPFPFHNFKNIKMMSKSVLNPGDIKNGVIKIKLRGSFWKLFQKLSVTYNSAITNVSRYVPIGYFHTLCFDKIVTKTNDNNIVVSRESNINIGCYISGFDKAATAPYVEAQ